MGPGLGLLGTCRSEAKLRAVGDTHGHRQVTEPTEGSWGTEDGLAPGGEEDLEPPRSFPCRDHRSKGRLHQAAEVGPGIPAPPRASGSHLGDVRPSLLG